MLRFLLSLIRLPLVIPLAAVQRLGGDDDRGTDEERPPTDHPAETEHGDEEQAREQPDSSPAEDSDTASGREDDEGQSSSSDEPAASGERDSDAEESGGDGSEGRRSEALAGEAPAGPSLGPHTDLSEFQRRKEEHQERLRENQPSQEDAMGLDKHRKIVGGTYGPTKTRLIATFSITIAIIAAVGVGLYILVGELDQAPEGKPAAKAPWSAADAPSKSPKRIQ